MFVNGQGNGRPAGCRPGREPMPGAAARFVPCIAHPSRQSRRGAMLSECRLPLLAVRETPNPLQRFPLCNSPSVPTLTGSTPLPKRSAASASLGYKAMELLADVPHAWPAGLLEEQKADIRACLARHGMAIANINAFMMNAVGRPATAVLASLLDRAGSALSGDPPRTHQTSAGAGRGVGRPGHPDRAGRTIGQGAILGRGRGRVLRRTDALRRGSPSGSV